MSGFKIIYSTLLSIFESRTLTVTEALPVSSIYIWSENLVAESEAKDGGN